MSAANRHAVVYVAAALAGMGIGAFLSYKRIDKINLTALDAPVGTLHTRKRIIQRDLSFEEQKALWKSAMGPFPR